MALVKANNDCWFPFKAHIMNGEVSHKTLTLWIKSKLQNACHSLDEELAIQTTHLFSPQYIITLFNTEMKEFTVQSPEVGSPKL